MSLHRWCMIITSVVPWAYCQPPVSMARTLCVVFDSCFRPTIFHRESSSTEHDWNIHLRNLPIDRRPRDWIIISPALHNHRGSIRQQWSMFRNRFHPAIWRSIEPIVWSLQYVSCPRVLLVHLTFLHVHCFRLFFSVLVLGSVSI